MKFSDCNAMTADAHRGDSGSHPFTTQVKTYYLETGSVDPAYNLAFEQYVLANRRAVDMTEAILGKESRHG